MSKRKNKRCCSIIKAVFLITTFCFSYSLFSEAFNYSDKIDTFYSEFESKTEKIEETEDDKIDADYFSCSSLIIEFNLIQFYSNKYFLFNNENLKSSFKIIHSPPPNLA